MDRLGIPNIYKLSIYHTVNLIFRVKHNTIPEAFSTTFEIVQHNYATFKFAISSRGSHLWNKHTDRFVKTITSALVFKAKLELIELRNVTNYF